MKLEKFEVMEDPKPNDILIKIGLRFDWFDLECMKAELGPEEFKKILSENIAHEILKEIEGRRFSWVV